MKKIKQIESLTYQVEHLQSAAKFHESQMKHLSSEVMIRRLLDDINDIGLDAPKYEELSSDIVNGLTQELAKAAHEIPRILNTISDVPAWPFTPGSH